MALTSQIDSPSTTALPATPDKTARVPRTIPVGLRLIVVFFTSYVVVVGCGIAAIAVNGALR